MVPVHCRLNAQDVLVYTQHEDTVQAQGLPAASTVHKTVPTDIICNSHAILVMKQRRWSLRPTEYTEYKINRGLRREVNYKTDSSATRFENEKIHKTPNFTTLWHCGTKINNQAFKAKGDGLGLQKVGSDCIKSLTQLR